MQWLLLVRKVREKPCTGRSACGKVPLIAEPQMWTESAVCVLRCLTTACTNVVTLSPVVFARSLRTKHSSSNLRNMSLQILACLGLSSCAKLRLQSSP